MTLPTLSEPVWIHFGHGRNNADRSESKVSESNVPQYTKAKINKNCLDFVLFLPISSQFPWCFVVSRATKDL